MIRCVADRLLIEVPMTMGTARGLLEAGRPYFDGRSWVVDLSRVEQADSAGLTVLLDWQRTNLAAGGTLSFVGMPAGLAALADLYDLGDAFDRA